MHLNQVHEDQKIGKSSLTLVIIADLKTAEIVNENKQFVFLLIFDESIKIYTCDKHEDQLMKFNDIRKKI